jgi:hypothetical protein
MHQPIQLGVLAGPDGHLQGVQRQLCPQGGRHPPADDHAGEGVDDKRHVGEPGPGGHVGEIGDPQAIGSRCSEVAVDQIGRALVAGGRGGGPPLGAPHDPTDAQLTHEPGDVVAADLDAFPAELPPELTGAVDLIVGVPDPLDLDLELGVAQRTG